MSDCKVSIITPCYNSEKTILKTVESVLLQTHTNFELIICDDFSTDSTVSLIKNIKDARIKIITNKYNKGAAGARNSGIDLAAGKYIAFLDSDDYWGPNKLKMQIAFMEKENSKFSYGNYFIVNDDIITGKFIAPSRICYRNIIDKCDIGCLTVMLERDFLSDFRFPEKFKEDYRLWLSILEHNQDFFALNYNGADSFYNLSTVSLSGNKLNELLRQWNVISEQKLSFYTKITCIIKYSFFGLYKHIIQYKSGNINE